MLFNPIHICMTLILSVFVSYNVYGVYNVYINI